MIWQLTEFQIDSADTEADTKREYSIQIGCFKFDFFFEKSTTNCIEKSYKKQ